MAGDNESEDKASWAVYTRAHGRGGLRLWWKPRGSGYTTNVHEAGLFTREEAERIQRTRSPMPGGSPADVAVRGSAVREKSYLVCSEDVEFAPEDRLPAPVRAGFGGKAATT